MTEKKLNILYVGPLNKGGTCLQRMNTFLRLGHQVVSVDTYSEKSASILSRIFHKLKIPIDHNAANEKIQKITQQNKFDMVWIDKGLVIQPKTIKKIKQNQSAKIVSYSPDDMINPSNQSFFYLRSIGLYNVHITTKSYNVEELTALGAKKVIFIDKAYDPKTHRKITLTTAEKEKYACEVGFIGQYEKERFQSMLFLAEKGIKITVRGPSWEPYITAHKNINIYPGFFVDEEYAKIINATQINLCFLRKVNRDLQTARSIEIPACGAFMLGERTQEHLNLFKEGIEADFFSSDEELYEKVIFYLSHEEKRLAIAEAGYQRCLTGKYSNDERMFELIEKIVTS